MFDGYLCNIKEEVEHELAGFFFKIELCTNPVKLSSKQCHNRAITSSMRIGSLY